MSWKGKFDSVASLFAVALALLFTLEGSADVGAVLMLLAIWCVIPHERHE